MRINRNTNLHAARKVKNDEFYTKLIDVENELCHYKTHLKDKVVYCNCDDPNWSSFYKYFTLNFKQFFKVFQINGFFFGWKQVFNRAFSMEVAPEFYDELIAYVDHKVKRRELGLE